MNSLKTKPRWINCNALRLVMEHSKARGSTYSVLIALAAHTNQNGTAWPSVERLAALARVSLRTVKRALRELEALGEITVIRQVAKRGTNLYRLELGRAQGGVNLTPEERADAQPSEGCQIDTRSSGAIPAQGGDRLSRGGDRLTPEHNNEKNTNIKPSPLPPSLEAAAGAGTKPARPPTHEEEEGVLKISQKAREVIEALGPDLASQLQRLYSEKAPQSRYGLWLETALYPQLERLGRSLFRAVVEQNLPAAAGSGIRYPSRFLVAKLEAEIPPAVPVSAARKDGGERPVDPPPEAAKAKSAARKGPMTMQELAAELEAALNNADTGPDRETGGGKSQAPRPKERYLARAKAPRCTYGDHRRSDGCCLPRALDVLQVLAPAATRQRDPIDRALMMPSLIEAYRRVVAERDEIPEALERLSEKRRNKAIEILDQLGLAPRRGSGVRGAEIAGMVLPAMPRGGWLVGVAALS